MSRFVLPTSVTSAVEAQAVFSRGQQIENSPDRRRQDHEIRSADGLGHIGIPLIDHFPADGAVNDLLTITADASAREARLLERQPPRSAHQAQTDNRDATKCSFGI